MTDEPEQRESHPLRNAPIQARSRKRLRAILDAADELLAREGAASFTTNRIAAEAGIPVGSVYRYFADKESIVEALAVRYWSDFDDLVAAAAELDEQSPLPDPGNVVLDALAAGFRARPGFLALWYGGLRTEHVRDATRPTRGAIARSIERILHIHWPQSSLEDRITTSRMVVVAGDGLLREAFRVEPHGDAEVLAESKLMLGAYIRERLGAPTV